MKPETACGCSTVSLFVASQFFGTALKHIRRVPAAAKNRAGIEHKTHDLMLCHTFQQVCDFLHQGMA